MHCFVLGRYRTGAPRLDSAFLAVPMQTMRSPAVRRISQVVFSGFHTMDLFHLFKLHKSLCAILLLRDPAHVAVLRIATHQDNLLHD